jgi:hypothetical protein
LEIENDVFDSGGDATVLENIAHYLKKSIIWNRKRNITLF